MSKKILCDYSIYMLTLQSRPQLSGSFLPVQLQLFPFPALHLINVAVVYYLYFPIILLFSNAALLLRISFCQLALWVSLKYVKMFHYGGEFVHFPFYFLSPLFCIIYNFIFRYMPTQYCYFFFKVYKCHFKIPIFISIKAIWAFLTHRKRLSWRLIW